jgi:serine/threonine-protein kinase RsbW
LKTHSDPAKLAEVRRAVESFARDCGFGDKAIGDVGLVVNEAMANVIRHAYAGQSDRPIEVTGEFRDRVLRIRIRDWGNGVNPETLPPKPPDPLRPGGLGLLCMKSLMDEVRYRPQSQGMLLEMTKTLDGPADRPK